MRTVLISQPQAYEFTGETIERGALGFVPVIRANFPKPKLQNNGYACFGGMPTLPAPTGLYAALPATHADYPNGSRQGDITVIFSDGKEFATWASLYADGGRLSLS